MSTPATILSFASGKGGTGKTTLALAFAYELSKSGRTLLVDLDFFNRGMTGLLKQADLQLDDDPIERHVGLFHFIYGDSGRQRTDSDWTPRFVSENLLFAPCAQIPESRMQFLQGRDVAVLLRDLRSFLVDMAIAERCDFVVLDTHGGLDSLSIAACRAATHTVLVSEPDRQSVYGTYNFVRALRPASDDHGPDIRLIFNRVTKSFSASFLVDFYDKYLASHIGGADVLGIVPYEAFIARAVGEHPISTSVYPFSLLSRKVELAVHALLPGAPGIRLHAIPLLRRKAIRRARFAAIRQPRSLELSDILWLPFVVSPAILASLVLAQGLTGVAYGGPVNFGVMLLSGSLVTAFEVAVALIVGKWARSMSDRFTFLTRTRRRLRSALAWAVLLGLVAASTYVGVATIANPTFGSALSVLEGEEALGLPLLLRLLMPESDIAILRWSLVVTSASDIVGGLGFLGIGIRALWDEWVRYLQTSREQLRRSESVGRVVVIALSCIVALFALL